MDETVRFVGGAKQEGGMTVDSGRRLVLFPGLAADERMYQGLGALSWTLVTPRLLIPRRHEQMADYARRHIESYGLGPRDVVGGCSFGSLLAGEICRQQPMAGLVLLSGALSSAALVRQSHRLQRLAPWVPFGLLRSLLASAPFMRAVFGEADPAQLELGRRMLRQTPKALLLEGGRLAASYRPHGELACPVFALHGAADRVFRPPQFAGLVLVPDAGHGMVVSHADEVTAFLRRVCQQLA